MLRLSPPALTAGLCRPFGAGFPFRSGVSGHPPRAAYGFRLRADSKFMIFFHNKQNIKQFFRKSRNLGVALQTGRFKTYANVP